MPIVPEPERRKQKPWKGTLPVWESEHSFFNLFHNESCSECILKIIKKFKTFNLIFKLHQEHLMEERKLKASICKQSLLIIRLESCYLIFFKRK